MWDRLDGVVRRPPVARSRWAIVGCGLVGSGIVWRAARLGVANLLMMDGDTFTVENVPRSVLPPRFVGMNKAQALAVYLNEELPWTRCRFVPRFVDGDMPDHELVRLLRGVSLAIVAVDHLEPQFQVNRAALAVGVPCLFPGLYGADGGEVFVSLGLGAPCFQCWAGFRPTDAPLRAVPAVGIASLAVEQATIHLALGILDPTSQFRAVLRGARGATMPRQLFMVENFGAPPGTILLDDHTHVRATAQRRPNCPGCAAGRQLQAHRRRPSMLPAARARRSGATPAAGRPAAAAAPDHRRRHTSRRRMTLNAIVAVEIVMVVVLVWVRFFTPSWWPPYAPTPPALAYTGNPGGTRAPTIAVVRLAPGRVSQTEAASQLVAGETGRILVRAPRAQTPSLTASYGIVEPPRSQGHGWWEWLYRAPGTPGRVRLTLEAVFPGQWHDANVTQLTFAVVAQQS